MPSSRPEGLRYQMEKRAHRCGVPWRRFHTLGTSWGFKIRVSATDNFQHGREKCAEKLVTQQVRDGQNRRKLLVKTVSL